VNDSRPFSPTEAILRAAVPLAALAAMAVFAGHEPAEAAREGVYLAMLAGAALLAAAFLTPAPAVELGAGAALTAAAVWALPAGPGRGAVVTLLLTALLAIAAGRRLASCLPDLPLDAAVPLALGVQMLLRGDLLFQPQASLRTLVALLALPTAGAVAAWMLARRHGGGPALLAAGTALVLAPGWNVAATLGLVALAAGDQLARPDLGRLGRGAAVLVLGAPVAWEPGPGLAAAVAGLALWRPRLALGLALPLAAALLWTGSRGHGPAPEPLAGLALLILLVPGLALPARDRSWLVPTALLLAAATPNLPNASALAAPLGLAALAVRREGPAAMAQRVWTAALSAGTALLAAYPWLRENPLLAAVRLAGLAPGAAIDWRGAAAVLAVLVLLVVAGRSWPGLRSVRRQAVAAAVAIFLAIFLHLPKQGMPLLPPESGVTLDAAHPAWVAAFPTPKPWRRVMVESSLSGGAALENGTPVAKVRLRDENGDSVLWILRAGEGTGEWAARRPDVLRTARLHSPPAWISWISEGFFAQRYRALWGVERPLRCTELRVEMARGLPADVGLTLHQVEVRR
jgi:hypothetical protein